MSYDPDEISPEALEAACERFDVDFETYVEGTDPRVDEYAMQYDLDKAIMKAEAYYEGDR